MSTKEKKQEYDENKAQGGYARAQILTPQKRKQIAQDAANVRWKKILRATHDGSINIGELTIEASVLEDGTRVLSYRGVSKALGKSQKWNSDSTSNLPPFLSKKTLKPYIPSKMSTEGFSPIEFKPLHGGRTAYGVPATLLPEICDVWLKAREAKVLNNEKDLEIAKKAEILVRGFARVGIIALVDEATGYQDIRDREALQAILEKYITDEWAKWTKTFPDDFYKHLFRLKGMTYPLATKNKPSYIGHWTNDIVYRRLAPGVLKKLKEINIVLPSGRRARKHHQYLTPKFGSPELKKHLDNIIFLMKACSSWNDFQKLLNKASPKYGDTIPMNLP
ncbi:MAG TPA: hypothetical protein DEB09_03010 [Candidatus Magasanikbacteria bacterium]|nr:hypothetical protein [Candidatus Magasanikbacteria bacterium]